VKYWLMKSEPDVYSIDDLARDKHAGWDGVRNYQARNYMREMQIGDQVLFYHSNATPSAVAGIAKVVKNAHADPTQFDRKSKYYDSKSSPEDPRWQQVELGFVKRLPKAVALQDIRGEKALAKMDLLVRSRLSVQAVKANEWRKILQMGGA
jgi:predicted RNA-binding protein with PUA-like domain